MKKIREDIQLIHSDAFDPLFSKEIILYYNSIEFLDTNWEYD